MNLQESIDLNNLPKHVAVIMDGNGRWAKQKGGARIFGHQNAIAAVRDTVEGAAELGIEYLTLNVALSYSGRWDLTQAIRQISALVATGELQPTDINEQLISEHVATAGMPDPELLIRTSGEMRISNFLLWQLAYTEIYITNLLWPDFRKQHLYEAILSYQSRERRFGKTSEQLTNKSIT